MLEASHYFNSRHEGSVLVLTIDVPCVNGEELCQTLGDALIAAVTGPQPLVVLDLRAVRYIASLGLAMLLRLHNHVREREGRMLLCGLSAMTADVLDVTRLTGREPGEPHVFDVASDVATAVKALAS